MDSNNKRIAKNTLMLYFRTMLTMGVALYTSRVVLNVLGVEDFGIYNVAGGVVVMFSFLNGAMGVSTSRFITIELGKQDVATLKKVFSVAVINHLFIALVIFLLAETIGLWFVCNKLIIPENRMSAMLWVYQLSILSSMFSLMQAPLNALIIAHERMNIYAFGSILDAVLKLLIVYLLSFFEFDKLKLYAILMLFVIIGMLLFYYIACRICFPFCSFSFYRDKNLHQRMLSYSGWDLIGNFSSIAQGQGLNMLLNLFFGPTVNAARGVAYQVQGAITQFSGNFMTAVWPQIIKYYAIGEKEKMIKLVFQSSKYSFFLLWIFTLPLLLEMEYVLTLWLKEIPNYTALFARIILIVSLINSYRNPFISALHATDKIKIPNIICGTILISTLPIAYIGLKMGLPAESVFYTTLVITIIIQWVDLFLLKKIAIQFSISIFFYKIFLLSLLVALISAILPIIIAYNSPYGLPRFIWVVVTSILSTVIAIYSLGVDSHTRRLINNKIMSFLKIKNKC